MHSETDAPPAWLALEPYNVSSPALEASRVVSAGQSFLFGLTVFNNNAAARFLHWFDASTLPANGAVPRGVLSIPGATSIGVNWLPPRAFQAGIVLANSTAAATLTLGTADFFFDAQYL